VKFSIFSSEMFNRDADLKIVCDQRIIVYYYLCIYVSGFAHGKKDRLMERRIKKDFQIGIVEGVINEIMSSEQKTTNIFSKIAKAVGNRDSQKKDWNDIVRKNTLKQNPIGSTNEAVRKVRQQSVRR